jgi:hypothetical protein
MSLRGHPQILSPHAETHLESSESPQMPGPKKFAEASLLFITDLVSAGCHIETQT